MSPNVAAARLRRANSAETRRKTRPQVYSAHGARLLACMALHEPADEFVPRLAPVEGVQNYPMEGGLATKQASILRMRRPSSALFCLKVGQLFQAAAESVDKDTDFFAKSFGPGEQAAAEELRECYLVAGEEVPPKLEARIQALSQGKGSILKREVRASVTPMVYSAKAIDQMDKLSCGLFGFGVGTVAAPIFFLHENRERTVDECKAKLAPGELLVRAGAPPGNVVPPFKRAPQRRSTPEAKKQKPNPFESLFSPRADKKPSAKKSPVDSVRPRNLAETQYEEAVDTADDATADTAGAGDGDESFVSAAGGESTGGESSAGGAAGSPSSSSVSWGAAARRQDKTPPQSNRTKVRVSAAAAAAQSRSPLTVDDSSSSARGSFDSDEGAVKYGPVGPPPPPKDRRRSIIAGEWAWSVAQQRWVHLG